MTQKCEESERILELHNIFLSLEKPEQEQAIHILRTLRAAQSLITYPPRQ